MKGVHPIFWLDGRATNPPIEEIGPSHVFKTAFHAEQGVDVCRSRVFGSRAGPIHAEPCRLRPQPSERRNRTPPRRKTEFTKKRETHSHERAALARVSASQYRSSA